jgi:hypothetical protein
MIDLLDHPATKRMETRTVQAADGTAMSGEKQIWTPGAVQFYASSPKVAPGERLVMCWAIYRIG